MVSILPLISNSSSYFSKPLWTFPSEQTTIGITNGGSRAALYGGRVLQVKKIEDAFLHFYVLVFQKRKSDISFFN